MFIVIMISEYYGSRSVFQIYQVLSCNGLLVVTGCVSLNLTGIILQENIAKTANISNPQD